MRRSLLRLFAVLLPVGLTTAAGGRGADSAPKAGEPGVVALPPFMVEELSKGPPWRYAKSPEFEILSRCDDRTTRELTEMYHRLHRLFALVVPPKLQVKHDVQKTIIYYDQELKPAASQEVIAQMLRGGSGVAIPPTEAAGFGTPGFRTNVMSPRRYTFLPNMRLWDKDSMAVYAIVRPGDLNSDTMYLTIDYVAYLLKTRTPTLPTWFIAGVLGMYPQLTFHGETLTLTEHTWLSPEQTRIVKGDPKMAQPLMPIETFFRADIFSDPSTREEKLRLWTTQAELFVRWGIDPGGGRREGFWKFVDRASSGVASEALLQECLGVDYAGLTQQLTLFLQTAVRKTATFHTEKTPVVPLSLRNATEGEIARIKGDWERLEIGYVRTRYPEVAGKYIEQARRTLTRAYEHDVRDPQLIAVLGLCEVDAGNDAAAKPYLEEAARLNVVRPRVWLELARLRLADYVAASGGGGRLSATQAAEVLTPLFTARNQNPPMPEVYELIAEVWERCSSAPKRSHLAVLAEGVTLFPHRVALLRRTAALHLSNGFTDEAAALIGLGLRLASDEADRAFFTHMQAQLPATAAAK